MNRTALAVALSLLCGCAAPPPASPAPEPDAKPPAEVAPLPREIPPLDTYEGVVADIVGKLGADDRDKLRARKKEDLILHHLGWGMSIRNEYRLWSNRALVRRCAARSKLGDLGDLGDLFHPDNASMLIIEGVWEAVRARD